MFGEISVLAWMGSAIVFAIGGGAGFFIARQIKDKRTLELEQQLQATQSKLTDYQDDVNRHFLKSSLLFNKLTDNYREVYEHLATGAQKLCNEKPLTTALDLPDAKILSAAIARDASAEEMPVETSSTTTETEHEDTAHLGVEGIVATEEILGETTEIDNSENSTPAESLASESLTAEPLAAKKVTAEPAVTPQTVENEAPTPEATDDTPSITEEELKTLEANEAKKEEADDVHLGAESTPGVELEHHKTHPSIH